MAQVTRRFFLLSSAALSVGCAMRRPEGEASPAANVRQPAVGQSWRYAQHDLFTGALVDDQLDRVATINRTIQIDSIGSRNSWLKLPRVTRTTTRATPPTMAMVITPRHRTTGGPDSLRCRGGGGFATVTSGAGASDGEPRRICE